MPIGLENGIVKYCRRWFVLLLLVLLGGCVQMSQSLHLSGYDRDIAAGSRAIEAAKDDAQRAAGYTKRGDAYSEKARYSRAFKLITAEEYGRLFGLAIKDHTQAIALAPASAEAYYGRGQAYYERAALEVVVNGMLVGTHATQKPWFDPAIADFKTAIEKDARHSRAWDMLGLSHETIGELDEAIDAYTHEMALDRLGKSRLADAYCLRGGTHPAVKKDEAIADYEKSIDAGASTDGCSCDPYGPLMELYRKDRQYDAAWVVVRRARNAGKWIAPELLDAVQKESGRRN